MQLQLLVNAADHAHVHVRLELLEVAVDIRLPLAVGFHVLNAVRATNEHVPAMQVVLKCIFCALLRCLRVV